MNAVADRPLRYHILRYWSPVAGLHVARLWVYDERGDEYFKIVTQDGTGRENKEARLRALEDIEQAMVNGQEPGEVT